jgi:hypothetical protein
MLGMTEMWSSLREQRRQIKAATKAEKEAGGFWIDALTALQVSEHADLTPTQIIEQLEATAPRAVRFRRRVPSLPRRRVVVYDGPIGARPDSPTERWTLGYLDDVISTRDPWMHRTDIAAATGAEMTLTAEHDGAIVADAVREWASRHGQSVELELTGPAGGSWSWGTGGQQLEMDALEFCRMVCGRGEAKGLLAVDVPF